MNEKSTNETTSGSDASRDRGGAAASEETAPRSLKRRNLLKALAVTGTVGGAGAGQFADAAVAQAADSESGWEPKPPQIETRWTRQVGPDNAHPEYPRPQLVRDEWRNLNGVWQFAGAAEGESPPFGQELDERILVPYPVESGLSGIKRHETWMWYRETFTVPDEWRIPTAHPGKGVGCGPAAQRLLLHFERVDWRATVYVNGEEVTEHEGGYDHFVVDVTEALVEDGPQELVVGVFDPTGDRTDPVGTQPKGRQGVGTGFEGEDTLDMTPTSGIWDTVWLEPVPESHVTNLDMTPDLDAEALRLTVDATAEDATVVATAYEDGEEVGRVVGPVGEELELPVPDPRLWSPDDPFLYDLVVTLRREQKSQRAREAGGGKRLDSVESYFGMRSIGKRTIDGTARPTLNGEPVWHLGTLESGQWPDGLYTAPTDGALRYNLAAQKELGYNMVRKHVKVETRRWFTHADELGLLVWQDMPHMQESFDTPPRDPAVLEHFEEELREVVTEHDNHPSMAVWVPINEGWGINNDNVEYVRELAELVAELDPERLVDAHSGFNIGSNRDAGAGDVKDVHQYGTPRVAAPEPEPDRISALGEYTSQSLVLPEHKWGECGSEASAETFVREYLETVEELGDLMVGERLSASVYTATTDLENVCNGQITYDREAFKAAQVENGVERVRDAHEALIEQSRLAMGNVVIDVETPPSYVSGELLGTRQPFEVAVTVSNPASDDDEALAVRNVSVDLTGGLPDDWTVAADDTDAFDVVADGESTTATWAVTPDATSDGDVSFDVEVSYEVGGRQYTYDATRTVSAATLASWRFENSPEDDSSYDNPVSLEGGAGFDDSEAVEAAYSLRLDGEDDYAQISGFGSGILHDAFSERTVSMWIKPDDTAGDQVLYNEGGTISGLGLRVRDGNLEAIVASNNRKASVSAPFTSTEWTHVAVVFDHGAFRLYVDGTEVDADEDVDYETVASHVAGSELGGNTTTTPWGYDSEDAFFGGNLDATAVYNLALTAEEVETVGRRSFSVDAPTLYSAGSDPQSFTVDATFSDLRADDGVDFEDLSMSVTELPDDWTSEPRTATTFDAVPPGDFVSATWDVTPDSSTTDSVEVEVTADYEVDGERRQLVDGARLETLESARIAQWPLDGTVEDASGNGHAATLENGASFDDGVAAQGSHSVALDGDDDFVDLAEGGEDFLSQSFSRRTVTAWVNPSSTSGSQVLYNQGAAQSGMAVRINDGAIEAGVVSDGTLATVSAPFTSTEWTHVAVVFDRGALRLYVDGSEVAADEDVGYAAVGGGFWGGELGTAEESFWSGSLGGNVDLSTIYDLPLSAGAIATLAAEY